MELNDILKPGSRCAFYGRHSTDKQDMLLQIDRAAEFAKNYDVAIVKKYLDPGVSATKKPLSKRQNLNELIDDLSKDIFDFVIVYKMDRMARDIIEIEEIRSILFATGKPIVIIDKNPPTLDEEPGDIFGFIKSALAQFEVIQNRERTREKAAVGAKRGMFQGGKPPFGYTYDKKTKRFSQIPEEILLVKSIFDKYLQGLGCRKIAKELQGKSYRGKDWTRDKVERIIKNPKYAGYNLWGKRYNHIDNRGKEEVIVPLEGIEPIITKLEWDRCQEQMKFRSQNDIDPKYYSTNYLFRGIIYCFNCNSDLSISNQETEGGKFGHKLYICESCKSRLKSEFFDRVVQNKIRTSIIGHNYKISEILNKLQKSFNEEIQTLQENIKRAEEGKGQYLIKINEIDLKIRRFSTLQFNEVNRSLIESFTLYRIDLQSKCDLLDQQIDSFVKRIDRINEVLLQEQYWIPVLHSFEKPRDTVTNSEWRLLVTEIVESVLIEKKPKKISQYKVELKLKYDLPSTTFTYNEENETSRKQLSFADLI
ncbi:recombinase family protein [Litchfieldia alkalitelluris]|uniref:recombinase family protein n=1 Tax=Litchfieldia alkalitelluris TaxID=304268 RepID=UPI0009965BFE|nr:recombinase family protein [Litchfieldia alkalitelluris]